MPAKDPPKIKLVKKKYQEFNSVRARDFLRTFVMRRLGAFIVAEGRPRSRECRVFP